MRSKILFVTALVIGSVVLSLITGGWGGPASPSPAQIERGKMLVSGGACNDCHTPKVFVKMGPMMVPVPDTTRLLSGHPADSKLPEVPKGVIAPDQWGGVFSNDLTAWAGPWGVSFTRNLTPDVATGIGSWTEDMFVKTIKSGKHMGEGRDILPPMPWPEYRNLPDADLKAIFAYLRSIKPVENAVPDPIAPDGMRVPTPMMLPKK